MRFTLLTLSPELCYDYLSASMLWRARDRGIVDYRVINLCDYSIRATRRVDDRPYGGGAGTILMAEPIAQALEAIPNALSPTSIRYVMTPRWTLWDQKQCEHIASSTTLQDIIILIGQYEGIDQRVIEHFDFTEISIGQYVLTSGILPALTIVDSIVRLIPWVITTESAHEDSFSSILGGKKEYPQYTRPDIWRDREVPPELLSGNPLMIQSWRHQHLL